MQISQSIRRSAIIAPSIHQEQVPLRASEFAATASIGIGTGARTSRQSAKDVSAPIFLREVVKFQVNRGKKSRGILKHFNVLGIAESNDNVNGSLLNQMVSKNI